MPDDDAIEIEFEPPDANLVGRDRLRPGAADAALAPSSAEAMGMADLRV